VKTMPVGEKSCSEEKKDRETFPAPGKVHAQGAKTISRDRIKARKHKLRRNLRSVKSECRHLHGGLSTTREYRP